MLGNMMNFFNQVVGNSVRLNVHLRNSAFYPGNVIEGYVEVVVSSPVPFRAIRVRACGKEMVSIRREYKVKVDTPQGEPQRYETRVRTEFSKQAVYNQLITLVGSMKTQPIPFETMLPAGTYYYPFAIQLPKNVPPSFSKKITDDYAEIVYYIKAYMDVPMGRDAVTRNFFRVIKPMPISQHATAAPFNFQNVYDVTCCCCIDKGKVGMRMFMNRTIIALDRDTLQVNCEIDNTNGQEPVEALTISLTNQVSYSANGMTEAHSLDAGTQTLRNQKIAPGSKGQLSGVVQLNRDAMPSLKTQHVQSSFRLSATVEIPWATDPVQAINVIVAQTVDESNWSEPMPFGDTMYSLLPKHYHTGPEMYYTPPPQPVFQYMPPPLGIQVPQYQQQATYQFQLPPFGLPPQQYQAMPMYIQGQPAPQQAPPSQVVWQQGYGRM